MKDIKNQKEKLVIGFTVNRFGAYESVFASFMLCYRISMATEYVVNTSLRTVLLRADIDKHVHK